MGKFTESKAISIVTANGGEIKGKVILVKYGLKGLKTCAAFDFLVNKCGFIGNL